MAPTRCRNKFQADHLKFIEEEGVSILCVAPRTGDEDGGPSWTYSIGLWQQYQHPEVLIMGLDFEVSASLINWFNRSIRDEARRFNAGTSHDDVLNGDYVCYFEAIPQSSFCDWFAGASWFYDGDTEFEAVQMIWPDQNYLYPWQAAASESFKALQPIISSLPNRALQ